MVGGYKRYDNSGYRATTMYWVSELEKEHEEWGREFPVSGDATLRWIGPR